MARPRAALFPRPRAAVKTTVERRLCSDKHSENMRRAFAWRARENNRNVQKQTKRVNTKCKASREEETKDEQEMDRVEKQRMGIITEREKGRRIPEDVRTLGLLSLALPSFLKVSPFPLLLIVLPPLLSHSLLFLPDPWFLPARRAVQSVVHLSSSSSILLIPCWALPLLLFAREEAAAGIALVLALVVHHPLHFWQHYQQQQQKQPWLVVKQMSTMILFPQWAWFAECAKRWAEYWVRRPPHSKTHTMTMTTGSAHWTARQCLHEPPSGNEHDNPERGIGGTENREDQKTKARGAKVNKD